MPALHQHQAGVDELVHVVREQRLLDVKHRDQLALAHRHLAATQQIDDLHPHRLRKRLRDDG